MAVNKRVNKNGKTVFRVRVRGFDGKFLPTKTFISRKDANAFDAHLKKQVRFANLTQEAMNITMDEFFALWLKNSDPTKRSFGRRRSCFQMYMSYVRHFVGRKRLSQVTPPHIEKILVNMADNLGRSAQTCCHVFNLLRVVFESAVSEYGYLVRNPVLKKYKPKVIQKESDHLTPEECKKLLEFVIGKEYELAVWIGITVGLRPGEIQFLRWRHINFETGMLHIRGTYAKNDKVKEKQFPKSRRWSSNPMSPQLIHLLKKQMVKSKAVSEYVVPSLDGKRMSYDRFLRELKKYCEKAGVRVVTPHKLRHSTSQLYIERGATLYEMSKFLNHSDTKVTQRYVHDKGSKMEKITRNMYLVEQDKLGSFGNL